MNIYKQKYRWKIGLSLIALLIVIGSLFYSNWLAAQLAEEERKKVELLADAFFQMNQPVGDTNTDINFLLNIIKNNTTIPVILTDGNDRITGARNLDDTKKLSSDSLYFAQMLQDMQNGYPPIIIESKFYADDSTQNLTILPHLKQKVYYADSNLLLQLRGYPYAQLLIIGSFLGIAYLAFSTARRAEQDKVWLGMAKETAHQLGTPLSSMIAWVELLKSSDEPQGQMVAQELEKDVARLDLIADRFSKIGSEPKLQPFNIVQSVERTLSYVKRRASEKVQFQFTAQEQQIQVLLNATLFDWVIENLLKNALDAMDGKGKIEINLWQESDNVIIDVTDSGKGIPKINFSTVFEPGYSTKKRGWGLGLSLSKRIVQDYHNGKIFVQQSVVDKGTTFRIIVPKLKKTTA